MFHLSCINIRDMLLFVFLKYLPQLIILVLLAVLIFFATSSHAAAQFITCTGTTCEISVFKSECPVISTRNTLEAVIPTDGQGVPVPIPADNIITFILNGTATDIMCNGSWQNLTPMAADPEIQNSLNCIIERGSGSLEEQTVIYSAEIFDQGTYSNIYTLEPSKSGYAELFGTSSNNPFCALDNEAEACKWQKQNINDNTLSENGVPLGNWVVYARTDILDYRIEYKIPPEGDPFVEPAGLCYFDQDNNGTIESNEYGACRETGQGLLCLLEAVECLVSTSEPLCPDGGGLNTGTDLCEAPSIASCTSPGFLYDEAADICRAPADCSDVGILNPTTDQCELLVADECPSGYSYDASLNKCTKIPTCSGDGFYDVEQDRCENSVIQTCPSGYTLNISANICESSPTCPSGSSYNTNYNKCTKTAIASCPTGYTDNNGTCEKTPTCPDGGSYSSTNRRCEVATAYECPIDNSSYSDSSTCNASCMNAGTCEENIQTEACYVGTGFTGYDRGCAFRPDPLNFGTGEMLNTYSGCPGNMPPDGRMADSTDFDGICLARHPTFNIVQPSFYLFYVSTSTFSCSLTGTSYSTLGTCQDACSQTQACTPECPLGYSELGNLCIANPTCSDGASFNSTSGLCEIPTTYSCSPGFTYDAAIQECVATATCDSGSTLNTNTDKCEISITVSCDPGYIMSGNICIETPSCSDGGFYDPVLNKCTISAAGLCPSGYTFDAPTDLCAISPECPANTSYSPTIDECAEPAIHDCPENYSYSIASGLCEALPICEGGAYRPETDDCLAEDLACPYGPEFPCLDYDGTAMCSPHECVSYQNSVTDAGTIIGANDAVEDGEIDENGSCLGTVYVFNGKDQRCRTDGVTIAFDDCCKSEDYLFGLLQCTESEKQLAQMRGQGLCHYVGEYCSKEVDLLLFSFCIEHSKTYCCFNSKLGRIIHEEGRVQMSLFDTWGVPQSPKCRGFKADEFQMVDFSRVDLTEWYGDINTKSQESVKTNVQSTIENYYDNL